MKVAIPLFFIEKSRVGGAEHMIYNLARGLELNEVQTELFAFDDQIFDAEFEEELKSFRSVRIRRRGKSKNRFLAETQAAFELDTDIALFPNYFTPPHFRRVPTATVVHDLGFLHHPSDYSSLKRKWLKLSLAGTVKFASQLITISEFSAESILQEYGEHFGNRLEVIPNPIRWSPAMNQKRIRERPFILSVAAQFPHKNLETLIRAFKLFQIEHPDFEMVLIGQHSDQLKGHMRVVNIRELIRELALEDSIHCLGYVESELLAQYYREASLFCFPSLYEGFGMPVAEALGYGVPTLTANRTALKQFGKYGAHFVHDALDPLEWCSKMKEMLLSPSSNAPSETDVSQIREAYDLKTIGSRYAAALHRCMMDPPRALND